MEPPGESILEIDIARTAGGYAGRAIVAGGPLPEPCSTVNVIGHGTSREELLQQLGELSNLLPYATKGQMHA